MVTEECLERTQLIIGLQGTVPMRILGVLAVAVLGEVESPGPARPSPTTRKRLTPPLVPRKDTLYFLQNRRHWKMMPKVSLNCSR